MHSIFFISKKEATEMEKKKKKGKTILFVGKRNHNKGTIQLLFTFPFFFFSWAGGTLGI
jgi:ribosomal protein S2